MRHHKGGKLRVLHVMHSLLHGGTEKLMLDILSRLPRDTYDVTATCYANQYLPDVLQAYQAAGIKTAIFSKPESLALSLDLARFIWRGRFRIVHTHYHWANLHARLAAILVGVPVVLTYQHVWPEREKERHRIVFRWLDRWTYCNVTISEALRRYNIEQVRIPPHQVVTVHNGIDTQLFRPRPTEQRLAVRRELGLSSAAMVVGMVGRLVEWKRFALFLQVASAVLQTGRDVHVLVVGDGPMRHSLVDLASQLGIYSHTHFLGWRSDMPDIYQAMDLFCITSDSGPDSVRRHGGEGFGLVSAEAMACEVPIVAVDTEVNREVISEECGVLCAPEAPALAEAVCRLIDDAALRQRLGGNGRARVKERFDINRTAAQLSSIYLQAVNDASPRRGRQRQ